MAVIRKIHRNLKLDNFENFSLPQCYSMKADSDRNKEEFEIQLRSLYNEHLKVKPGNIYNALRARKLLFAQIETLRIKYELTMKFVVSKLTPQISVKRYSYFTRNLMKPTSKQGRSFSKFRPKIQQLYEDYSVPRKDIGALCSYTGIHRRALFVSEPNLYKEAKKMGIDVSYVTFRKHKPRHISTLTKSFLSRLVCQTCYNQTSIFANLSVEVLKNVKQMANEIERNMVAYIPKLWYDKLEEPETYGILKRIVNYVCESIDKTAHEKVLIKTIRRVTSGSKSKTVCKIDRFDKTQWKEYMTKFLTGADGTQHAAELRLQSRNHHVPLKSALAHFIKLDDSKLARKNSIHRTSIHKPFLAVLDSSSKFSLTEVQMKGTQKSFSVYVCVVRMNDYYFPVAKKRSLVGKGYIQRTLYVFSQDTVEELQLFAIYQKILKVFSQEIQGLYLKIQFLKSKFVENYYSCGNH